MKGPLAVRGDRPVGPGGESQEASQPSREEKWSGQAWTEPGDPFGVRPFTCLSLRFHIGEWGQHIYEITHI